ncbi:hypothetical protein F5Y05DRAFT_182855 [Hypoxylon sp. FL0543]|nr:hypothetical protein F5Y05DRAFT_182855 [Hypoxylon sp. FL0543]
MKPTEVSTPEPVGQETTGGNVKGSNTSVHPSIVDVPALFSLTQRSIIVTGATGGLGYSVVEALLQSGADVIATDLGDKPSHPSWGSLESLADKLHLSLTYWPCDISNSDATCSVFRQAVSQARYPLRGLVTCAGIGWAAPSIDFPISDARKVLDVNLVGTLICAQAAAQLVQEQDVSASFVFIASMSGYVVNKGISSAMYSASKAGVQQLTRNLAAEWGVQESKPSIRVNSISPGVIRTPMTTYLDKNRELKDMWTENTMLKRLAEPEDFRGPVVFLLSDASGYVTAADLLVDAGYTAW